MKFRSNQFGLQFFILGAALFGLWFTSCNVLTGESRTYMKIKKDSTWNSFDSLEITWYDSSSRKRGTLFQGSPEKLGEVSKLPADGYPGQVVTLFYRGFIGDSLVSEVAQIFNPDQPTVVVLDTLKSQYTDSTPITVDLGPKPLVTDVNSFTLSILDSVSFNINATLDLGSLAAYTFDYDSDGTVDDSAVLTGMSATVKGGYRYLVANTYTVKLRVYSARGAYTDTQFLVVVLQDEPRADAGPNQTVFAGETVHLSGYGYDSLGEIKRMEWKVGDAAFTETSGRLSFVAPIEVGDLPVVLRVIDDDAEAATDTAIIHVLSRTQASLTDLRISHGNLIPSFHPNDTVYRDTVPYAITKISITPFGNGILSVNEDTVISGSTYSDFALKVGENSIRIVARLEGISMRSYLLHVVRKSASEIKSLRTLSLSSGNLSPKFSPEELTYSVTAANSISSITISAILTDSVSTLRVNDTIRGSSTPVEIKLNVGENRIRINVTAENGEKQTYTVLVSRAANDNADLSDLAISAGALTPDFSETTTEYNLTVESHVTTVDIKPTTAAISTRTKVNGISVDSANSSVTIALKPGANGIAITLTAESGKSKTYIVNLIRKVIPRISAGDSHSFFIKSDGSAWVTGYNYYGQLGDSTTSEKSSPTRIMKDSAFTQVAGGFAHSLLVSRDGSLWATGYNYNGQLGDGTNTPKFTPVNVMKGSTFTQIAASGHSLMLKHDGTLWATGSNYAGQLGDGTTINKTDPVHVMAGSIFTQIAAGDGHSLMLKSDGTLWGMGLNRYGQLGDGTDTTRLTPIQVMKGSTFIQIAAGGESSLMIKTDGTLWATGYNHFGQLGDSTDTTRLSPIQVMPGSTFTQVTTGGRHSLFVKSDGSLWATGAFLSKNSGDGESTPVFIPTLVMSGSNFTQIAAGRYHSLFLKSDGSFWAMGGNNHGQLGDGTKIDRDTPVQVILK